MKKLITSLVILILFNLTDSVAQCSFDYSTSGTTITIDFGDTLSPFFDIDSVSIDFGDGSSYTAANVPTNSIFNFSHSHTYPSNGNYIVCINEYTDWGGAPQPPCTHCDTITIGSSAGCSTNAEFTFSQNDLTATFTNQSTCVGCLNVAYTWDFATGDIGTQMNPVYTFPVDSLYPVCLYVAGSDSLGNPCFDTICHTLTVINTAISEYSQRELKFYPNPVASGVTVDLPILSDLAFLKIIDVAGRIVYTSRKIDKGEKNIYLDVAELSAGIYQLQLITKESNYHSKLLKD